MLLALSAVLLLFFDKCILPIRYTEAKEVKTAALTDDTVSTDHPGNLSNVSIDSNILLRVFGYPPSSPSPRNSEADPDNFKPSKDPHDEFDWRLTRQVVSSTSEQNILVSPLCLKLSLAFLIETAIGITATELSSVLGFEASKRQYTREKLEKSLESLFNKSNDYIFDLGSRIYIANDFELSKRSTAIAELYYKTQLEVANFEVPGVTVQDINSWVSNITQGSIRNIVTNDDVSGAVMAIFNTIYFKGTWRHQFELDDTRFDKFFSTLSKVYAGFFMKMENNFFYVESDKMDAKILRLPYSGNKFSMYLIVPNSISGMDRVLSSLTAHQLRQEMSFLTMRKVRVMLPHFRFEYAPQLHGLLKDLGIRKAFEQTASFPGLVRGHNLSQIIRISRVMQKSGIDLNELGSSVHTAPDITYANKFVDGEEGIVEVQANRPFLFFIEDESTRQLLFTGYVFNPTASKSLRPVVFIPLENI